MASAGVQQVLKKVYDDDTDATAVCELLVDLDEGMQEWRYRHVKMVERTIGGAARHRRLGRRHLPADHARAADLPRPMGRPEPGLADPPRPVGHAEPGKGG